MINNNSIRLGVMPPLTGMVDMYGQEITFAAKIACQEVKNSERIVYAWQIVLDGLQCKRRDTF